MVKISSNIKHLRGEQGISQTALAQAIGLNRGNIASYEKELAQPSVENLIKIADYFHISLDELCRTDLSDNTEQPHSFKDIIQDNLNLRGLKNRVMLLKGDQGVHHKIAELKKQNAELSKIVAGFEAYHQHKMAGINNKSEDIIELSSEYKKVLDLLNTLIKTNKELIKLIE